MEPFLISLVGALAAGAVAAAKDTAAQAIKDAYAGVRQYIEDRYAAVHLEGLDKDLCLSEIKSGHIRDAIRPGLGG